MVPEAIIRKIMPNFWSHALVFAAKVSRGIEPLGFEKSRMISMGRNSAKMMIALDQATKPGFVVFWPSGKITGSAVRAFMPT